MRVPRWMSCLVILLLKVTDSYRVRLEVTLDGPVRSESTPYLEQDHFGSPPIENSIRCHACGHSRDASCAVEASEGNGVGFRGDSGGASCVISDAESVEFAYQRLVQVEAEGGYCLKDIFFSNKTQSTVLGRRGAARIELRRRGLSEIPCSFIDLTSDRVSSELEAAIPWLTSRPDAYDCADVLLDLCQDNNNKEETYQGMVANESEPEVQCVVGVQRCCNSNPRSPSHASVIAGPSTKSDYFAVGSDERRKNSFLKRWIGTKAAPIKHFAAALQVGNVIRQVDRKFILVQAVTSRGRLVLCIDQHAADERVRLEKLEEEMFGRDGSLRRVETQEHEPPLALRMNCKERQVLNNYEELIRSWGFDFEYVTSEPETIFFCMRRKPESDEMPVCCCTQPKSGEASRERRRFPRLHRLPAQCWGHYTAFPNSPSRLLRSRACRSAIMFGDWLNLGQCRDLIEELKTCQLPFQCAHGRPSVVPLAKILSVTQ
ncbi:DNA mismatch repair protein [Phytophthora pseudosyringae]|uniref:DNA mismatch repair protein n=1 Tax=Phytophthora pseudosyringae TaxID=221518 RepID=A0A8T1W7M6_9STRA|nr:DNA mismatch repair protein [Phytophthora pseudosyringae]